MYALRRYFFVFAPRARREQNHQKHSHGSISYGITKLIAPLALFALLALHISMEPQN